MTTTEITPKAAVFQVRELVKPQKQFDMLNSDVEALCGEYNHLCSCSFMNTNASPDEDLDILF